MMTQPVSAVTLLTFEYVMTDSNSRLQRNHILEILHLIMTCDLIVAFKRQEEQIKRLHQILLNGLKC